MRYLIFSDIHSNLEALESVLAHASTVGYEFALSLGDHVGYGANPNECIEAVAQLPACVAIKGNHDAAVLDRAERAFFNLEAHQAIIHTERFLSEASRAFLQKLPLVYDANGIFLGVHSSPCNPAAWGYILDAYELEAAFRCLHHPMAFVGHSHIPCVYYEGGEVSPLVPGDTVRVQSGRRVIINVGSVGQPRDGNPDAAYVLYDDTDKTAEIFRVGYDREKAAEEILRAGLPSVLAQRILSGY